MNKSEMLNFLDNKFRKCNPEFLKLSQVYFEDYDGDAFCDFLKQLARTMGADCVHGGCSKSVFHFNEFKDYVFKIPYIGYAYIEDEYTQYYKECAEQERVPTYFCFDDVTLYKNANNDGFYPVDANDYCAAEEYIYRMARKYKVHQMLAAVNAPWVRTVLAVQRMCDLEHIHRIETGVDALVAFVVGAAVQHFIIYDQIIITE